MKLKNLLIGTSGLIISGTAIATENNIDNLLVTAKYAKISASVCCDIIDVECGAGGSNICLVSINGTTHGAYQDAACTMSIMTSRTTPIITLCEP
jgi:hypothetical protein